MKEIPAKSILSGYRNDTTWFGSNYTMNLYRGCCHGCIYCDSRSTVYGIDDFDTVSAKTQALEILERELKSKRRTGIVHFGSMSDSYNPFERETKLSRGALALLEKYQYGVCLPTKSTLVTRDADILQSIARHAPAVVNVTVNSVDATLCAAIEPHAPDGLARLKALQQLRKQGVDGGVLLMPVLPFISDNADNIKTLVAQAAAHGARWIYAAMGMTTRDGQREYYFQQLDKLFVGVRERHWRTFGSEYNNPSPHAKALWALFSSECERHGLLYRMEDVVQAIRQPYEQKQLSLFD